MANKFAKYQYFKGPNFVRQGKILKSETMEGLRNHLTIMKQQTYLVKFGINMYLWRICKYHFITRTNCHSLSPKVCHNERCCDYAVFFNFQPKGRTSCKTHLPNQIIYKKSRPDD